jgi:hypothetical protein
VDVSSRIRAQLAEGKWPEEIITALVAEGMTEANARRIVERITAEGVAPPLPSKPADPALARRFPLEGIAMLVAAAALGGAWLYEASRAPTPEEQAAADRVEQRKVEDQKRAAELAKGGDLQSQAKAIVEGMMANAQNAQDLRAGAELLQNNDPFMRCEGARLYQQSKLPDQGGHLARLLENDPDLSVRRCSLDALLASGVENVSTLNVLERIESNPVLRDIVVSGYTRLSQDAAEDVRTRAHAGLQRLNR